MNQSIVRAYEGREPFIFVSYAHKDAAQVLPVIAQLQHRGYRVWYDEGIVPGSEWTENIALHLNNCAAVIAFLSPNSVNSPNCRREITYALSKNKPFLGIFLTETAMSPGMELQISSQQCIMKYQYQDQSLFYEKVCAFPALRSCKMVRPAENKPPEPTPVRPVAPPRPVMRKLSIHRRNSSAGAMMGLNLYLEDSAAGDVMVYGVRCRTLGCIHNGESMAFMIPITAAKVYLLPDLSSGTTSWDQKNGIYSLPAGTEDVVLSGECCFNPVTGNSFRFDGVGNEIAPRKRKSNRVAILAIVITVVVAFFAIIGILVGTGVFEGEQQVASKIFVGDRYKITLTEEFQIMNHEDYHGAYETEDIFVVILEEGFQHTPELENYSLYDYADYILQINEKECDIKAYGDYLYFEYVSTSGVSGEDLHYFVSMHKGPDAFWLVQFVTAEENASGYLQSILRWADTFAPDR